MRVLIGNGPSVLRRKLGKKIDTAETVVRLGSFKIKGYEEYVGTKTDIWVTLNRNRYKHKCAKTIVTSVQDQKRVTDQYHIPRRVVDAAYKCCGIKTGSTMRPTTGLLAIAYCLLVLEWPVLHIVGFDNCKPTEKKHYWEPDTDQVTYKYHNVKHERNFIHHFEKTGQLCKLL